MTRLGVWEILTIVLLVVILFAHNKIPGMMKNLADGLNTFKKELKDKSNKIEKKPVNAGDADGAVAAEKQVQKTAKKPVKAGPRSGKVGQKKGAVRGAKK